MVFEGAWRLGVGVTLAWAALPWLVKLARRSRSELPTQYYRMLLAALGFATALIFLPLVRGWSGALMAADVVSSTARPVVFATELVRTAASALPSAPWLQLLAAIGGAWLLLLAAGVAVATTGYVRLRRQYAEAEAAPAHVLAQAEHIAAELGVSLPPIRVSDGTFPAFTYGAVSPVIVISRGSCQLPEEELEFVLRHELCHVARHDTRAMCLIELAQRCFAGHPSLPALAAEIRVAREARADETAAGHKPLEYARFLITIAEHIHSLRLPSRTLVSMADTALERRVQMLIDPSRSRLQRSTHWLALTGVALCSLVFLTPASWGQPERPTSQEAGALMHERDPGRAQGLPPAVIRETIRGYLPQLRACFEQLKELPSVQISLNFIIDRDGKALEGETVDKSEPAASPGAFNELAKCIDGVRRTMQFPVPDEIVVVNYPLTFESEPCTEQ